MAIDPALREEIRQVVLAEIAPIRVRREEHEELLAAIRTAIRELQVLHAQGERDHQEATARVDEQLRELAAAQARTEQAQTRTEQAVRGLAASQARTDEALRELAAAQARTDEAVRGLAAAQARTEQTLARTEEAVARLTRSMDEFRQDLGQRVEEIAAEVVPHYLQHEEGITVGDLGQEFFKVNGQEFEVDLAGDGRRGDESLLILCEAKSSADLREVERLAEKAEKIGRATGRRVYPVLFPTRCSGRARTLARQVGVLVVPWRYQYRIA